MGSCPPWNANISAATNADFRAGVGNAYADVANRASRDLITFDAPPSWHFKMFWRFVPLDYYAGNYRQDDASRPCLGMNVAVGTSSGSDYRYVLGHMRQAISVAQAAFRSLEINWGPLTPADRALRLVHVLSFLVGRFIQIHPFINGNGRTSRLVWAWGLLRFGVPVQARISPRPGVPYQQLMGACMQGNFRPLALHILRHLAYHAPTQA